MASLDEQTEQPEESMKEAHEGMYSDVRDEGRLETGTKEGATPGKGNRIRNAMEERIYRYRLKHQGEFQTILRKLYKRVFPYAHSVEHAYELIKKENLDRQCERFPRNWTKQAIERYLQGKLIEPVPEESPAPRNKKEKHVTETPIKMEDMGGLDENDEGFPFVTGAKRIGVPVIPDIQDVVTLPSVVYTSKQNPKNSSKYCTPTKMLFLRETTEEREERFKVEYNYWLSKVKEYRRGNSKKFLKDQLYNKFLAKLIWEVFPICKTEDEVMEVLKTKKMKDSMPSELPPTFKDDIKLGLENKLKGQNDDGSFLKSHGLPFHVKKFLKEKDTGDSPKPSETENKVQIPVVPLTKTADKLGVLDLEIDSEEKRTGRNRRRTTYKKHKRYDRFLANLIRHVLPEANALPEVYDGMAKANIAPPPPDERPYDFVEDIMKGLRGELEGQQDDGYWCDVAFYGKIRAGQIREEREAKKREEEAKSIMKAQSSLKSKKPKPQIKQNDFKNRKNDVKVLATKFNHIVAVKDEDLAGMSRGDSNYTPPYTVDKKDAGKISQKIKKSSLAKGQLYEFQDEAKEKDKKMKVRKQAQKSEPVLSQHLQNNEVIQNEYIQNATQPPFTQVPAVQFIQDDQQLQHTPVPQLHFVTDPQQPQYMAVPQPQYMEIPHQQYAYEVPQPQYSNIPEQQYIYEAPQPQYANIPQQQYGYEVPHQQYGYEVPQQQYSGAPQQYILVPQPEYMQMPPSQYTQIQQQPYTQVPQPQYDHIIQSPYTQVPQTQYVEQQYDQAQEPQYDQILQPQDNQGPQQHYTQ